MLQEDRARAGTVGPSCRSEWLYLPAPSATYFFTGILPSLLVWRETRTYLKSNTRDIDNTSVSSATKQADVRAFTHIFSRKTCLHALFLAALYARAIMSLAQFWWVFRQKHKQGRQRHMRAVKIPQRDINLPLGGSNVIDFWMHEYDRLRWLKGLKGDGFSSLLPVSPSP